MEQGIVSAIGNTPVVQLTRVLSTHHFALYGKLEGSNPGGSIKDRAALNIVLEGLKDGSINRETTIIESSSGNMGVGLALVCRYYGLKCICVVDAKTTAQNVSILRAYGACVDIVDPDPATGEYLAARIRRVKDLLCRTRNAFWPNQYANIHNARAQKRTIGELVNALGGRIDYIFCAVSTCGTLRGCAEYISENPRLKAKIVAVDAVGSVIFGGVSKRRLIPGHGAAIVPELFAPNLADAHVYVSDAECVIGCRRLLTREAILAGGSSGATIMAIEKMKTIIPRGALCAAILPDRGERYIDTIFSDVWIHKHFGDLSRFWTNTDSVESSDESCIGVPRKSDGSEY